MTLKLVGSREWGSLTKLRHRRIRYFFDWEWNRPRRYLFLGLPESGKSATNEVFAERHPHIIDIYGSKDNENLCWCRDTSPIDDVLLIHGDNTEVEASFETKRISDVTISDVENYEGIVTCHAFYSSDAMKFSSIQKLADQLYSRLSWRKGDIVYLLMRETMNVIYARTSQGMGEKEAKADLLYFIRELRHFGFSVGADILRWTGADKELRDLSDFMIFKQVGEKGLPREKRYLYNYLHPISFAQMKSHEFVALRKDGAIAYCQNALPRYHKEEGVNLLAELGIRITHSEEPIDSTTQQVGDHEHIKIIQLYHTGISMENVAKTVHRSLSTISRHVAAHNKSIERYGVCQQCKRGDGDLLDITITTT